MVPVSRIYYPKISYHLPIKSLFHVKRSTQQKLTRLEDHCQTVYCSPLPGLLCLSDPWTANSLQGTQGTQMHKRTTSADVWLLVVKVMGRISAGLKVHFPVVSIVCAFHITFKSTLLHCFQCCVLV